MATIIDEYPHLIKMKQAGVPAKTIAGKLAISEEEVERIWKQIELYSVSVVANGYTNLCDMFTAMVQQYNLLGETIKYVAAALHDTMDPKDLRALVDDDKDKTVESIMNSALVLKPFRLPDAIKMVEALEKQSRGEQN